MASLPQTERAPSSTMTQLDFRPYSGPVSNGGLLLYRPTYPENSTEKGSFWTLRISYRSRFEGSTQGWVQQVAPPEVPLEIKKNSGSRPMALPPSFAPSRLSFLLEGEVLYCSLLRWKAAAADSVRRINWPAPPLNRLSSALSLPRFSSLDMTYAFT